MKPSSTAFASVVILCFIQQTVAMTTTMKPAGNHTHNSHETSETDSISFTYDAQTHMLLVRTGSKCYIWTLTHKELNNVHTDEGLRNIELRVLNEIDGAFYTVINGHILAASIHKACGSHATSFYVVH